MTFDIENCTVQEACDYAVKKIVEQGGRCKDHNDECVYGNSDGNHCAIGWLLDHEDDGLMCFEGGVSFLISSTWAYRVPAIITENETLFTELQKFHDTGYQDERIDHLHSLKKYSIDTSGDHWQQWVEMGQ